MTGVAPLFPGKGAVQRAPSVGFQEEIILVSGDAPLSRGPRHCGQFPPDTATDTSAITTKPIPVLNREIVPVFIESCSDERNLRNNMGLKSIIH
jgi:hypothetical protein